MTFPKICLWITLMLLIVIDIGAFMEVGFFSGIYVTFFTSLVWFLVWFFTKEKKSKEKENE